MSDPMSEPWDGRPETPERRRYHWLERLQQGGQHAPRGPYQLGWNLFGRQAWHVNGASCPDTPEYMASINRYLGPVLTPAEIAAREQAAWQAGAEAMREVAVAAVINRGNFGDYQYHELTRDYGQPRFEMMQAIVEVVRALPLPTPPDGESK